MHCGISGYCSAVLSLHVLSGVLTVPEYDVTKENVVIAKLNLDLDEFTTFNIVCQSDYCNSFTPPDYGLITIDKQSMEIR